MANRIFAHHQGAHLNLEKVALIDFACQRLNMRSFADLGGVWNVDGGYTFYAMEKYGIAEATIVDTDMTPAVLERQRRHPGRVVQERCDYYVLGHWERHVAGFSKDERGDTE